MSGNSLVIYYSWVGNTAAVAAEIQRLTGFRTERILEVKERTRGRIMGAAMGAFFGRGSRIRPIDFTLASAENILLGCQVWAGKTTPAINTFLSEAHFKNKKVWLFITLADNQVPQKVLDSISRRIERKGGQIMDTLLVVTKMDTVIEDEKIRQPVHDWLAKNGLLA